MFSKTNYQIYGEIIEKMLDCDIEDVPEKIAGIKVRDSLYESGLELAEKKAQAKYEHECYHFAHTSTDEVREENRQLQKQLIGLAEKSFKAPVNVIVPDGNQD